MKENLIPTKDLKTGVKVTAKMGEGVYKALEPHLKRAASNSFKNILEAFNRKA